MVSYNRIILFVLVLCAKLIVKLLYTVQNKAIYSSVVLLCNKYIILMNCYFISILNCVQAMELLSRIQPMVGFLSTKQKLNIITVMGYNIRQNMVSFIIR